MLASDYFIGLMSGTSADAIDAALVDFSENLPKLVATHSRPLSATLQERIHQLATQGEDELNQMAELDQQLGELFAEVTNELLIKAKIEAKSVAAIGSHGQTLRHCPNRDPAFTCQIASPAVIAARTGITTVADFRSKDIALGGQGAPLTPAFHAEFYRHKAIDRIVLNLGGIANITFLPAASERVVGFDTGPANTLLDAWCRERKGITFDAGGDWAKSGCVDESLLGRMLEDEYFNLAFPKSTGIEYFNLRWLSRFLQYEELSAVDVQATLLELTVRSIVGAVCELTPHAQILVAGGGAKNAYLMERLRLSFGDNYQCESIDQQGVIEGDWLEAVAFAWFAKCCLARQSVDLRSVTGACAPAVLGVICWA